MFYYILNIIIYFILVTLIFFSKGLDAHGYYEFLQTVFYNYCIIIKLLVLNIFILYQYNILIINMNM